MIKRILFILIALLAIAVLYVFNPSLPSPEGPQSAALYESGPYGVQREAIELTDTGRPTPANGEFEGSASRQLNGYVWYPENAGDGPYPLIVYSHGFMSSVAEADYAVDFLVPKGYVVAAVDYPLSNGSAPGGPTVTDVINQAGDVSFVIDSMLARNEADGDSLQGLIDPQRIAAVGLSLGGMTSQLAGFHPTERDPRLQAAVSIAGPSAMLERAFFESTDLPFLMIAGTADAIVPYEANAAPMPGKVDGSLLVTLDGGSHVGFVSMAALFLRWFDHPDALICPMLVEGLEGEGGRDQPMLEPDPSLGISSNVSMPCTMDSFGRAMRPAEQQMLTRLALYAFLERELAEDTGRRQEMDTYLRSELAQENVSVTVEAADSRP